MSNRGRWLLIGTALVLVAALYALVRLRSTAPAAGGPGGGGRFGQGGPSTVGAAMVSTGDIPLTVNALGTVTPLATATVRAQVTGTLSRIDFSEGQLVRAGQLLAEIDARPYQATLDAAIANLHRDQASLENARHDQQRFQELLDSNLLARQQYDTQASLVKQGTATVAADQAAVAAAQINRDYCRIVAPVAGRVGLRQVDVGNLVQANATTGIAVVTQLQPISVLFSVPEDRLQAILKRMRGGDRLAVSAYDRAQATKLAEGTLVATDNQVDTSTGTLRLRASFANGDGALFPNQFVNVTLLLDTLHGQTIVPSAALQNGAAGNYVYVVGADQTVSLRGVTVGPADGDRVSVIQGLQPGERVVTDGADQLRDGAHVTLAGAKNTGAGGWPHRPGAAPGAEPGGAAAGGAAAGRAPGQRPGAADGQGWTHRHRPEPPTSSAQ